MTYTEIQTDDAISYSKNTEMTEVEFLSEIHAATKDESVILSDFNKVVDLNTAGIYEVTLNAQDSK
ncbi:hypothetical protein BED65_15510 [Listeria monocytogenes]|nr:hypothetical protein [Listeria monocytogenes]